MDERMRAQIAAAIVAARPEKPRWGHKIREPIQSDPSTGRSNFKIQISEWRPNWADQDFADAN